MPTWRYSTSILYRTTPRLRRCLSTDRCTLTATKIWPIACSVRRKRPNCLKKKRNNRRSRARPARGRLNEGPEGGRMRSFLLGCVLSLPLLAGVDDDILIRGATVHPVSGPEIKDGSILVRDGKIVGIGHNLAAPRGTRVIEAKGLYVYPGMINSATELGLAEINSIRESVDTGELGDFNPQLRAEIAVNPSSEHIPVTRANGITTAIVLPMGPGGGEGGPRGGNTRQSIINGQAALVHLDGWTWEEMEVKKSAGMAMRFPIIPSPQQRYGDAPPVASRYSYADSKKAYETQLHD